MQFPITIGLHRSRFLAGTFVFLHVLALAALLATPWPWAWRVLGAVLLAAVAAHGWRQLRSLPAEIRLGGDGGLSVRPTAAGEFMAVSPLGPATAHPLLCVLRYEVNGHRHALVVFPDSVDAEGHRQLRVWLRWRADFSAGAAAAG